MDHDLWPRKGSADEDQTFSSSSRIEPKRTHQWFIDGAELNLYPCKKQAVGPSNTMPMSGITAIGPPPTWDQCTNYQRETDQFVHQLFGSEAPEPNLSYRNISPGGPLNLDPNLCFSYGGLRKVKVDQVKGDNDASHYQKGHNSMAGIDFSISENQVGNMNGGSMLLNQIYNEGEVHNEVGNSSAYVEGAFSATPINTCSKEEILFDQPYDASSVHMPEPVRRMEPGASTPTTVPKSKSRNKLDVKSSRKEAPNSFPTNVKSLISTGILDGVPVKYISVSRESKMLHGVIKGSGYLCGCQSCNYSKEVNAYEFERHAGCKTKHPNKHIFFDNAKTIYQVVQELKSTPQSKLFDVIQTVFGSPINQKSFKIWKESYEAATRELQRIYGKDELNL